MYCIAIFIKIEMCILLIIQHFGLSMQDNDKQLIIAERKALETPEKADSILGEIQFTSSDFIHNSPHTNFCHVNILLAKCILCLRNNRINESKQLLKEVTQIDIRDGNNNYSNEDFELLESLILKADSMSFATKEQLTNILMETLKNRLDCHFPIIQISVEERLYSSKYYFILLTIFLIISVSLYLYMSKSDKNAQHIILYQSTIEELNMELEKYIKTKNEYQEKVSFYKNQLNILQNNTNIRLGKGKIIMDNILKGGQLKNISIEDEQCFVDYYAFTNPEKFSSITKEYKALSLRHATYLILVDLNFSDSDIQRILFVKDSTIRNYRSRMKKKKR